VAVADERTILCVVCGATRSELLSVPADRRSPCPTCGSAQAQLKLTLDARVVARGSLGFKVRAGRPGKVAPHVEGRTGDSFTGSTGRWSKRVTRIDRLKDWYDEIVTDEKTGEVIHECHEPLSDHRGHGAAKRKSSST